MSVEAGRGKEKVWATTDQYKSPKIHFPTDRMHINPNQTWRIWLTILRRGHFCCVPLGHSPLYHLFNPHPRLSIVGVWVVWPAIF